MTWYRIQLAPCLAWFFLIASSSVPSAHALEPGQSNPPALNEKELFPYKPKGRGTATGQVFLSSPSGKALTQAGVPVYLIPTVPYTRHWFDRNVRTSACASKGEALSTELPDPPVPFADCLRTVLTQLLTEKRLAPYLRTTRANPTGHFWFTKVPAGRYYIVSLLEGSSGSHQDERAIGIAWSTMDLDVGEKAANLVVTDCRNGFC
ncbi:MAG: hypothetical protein H8K03_11870 [Nitrospira sp.]|jgi:hypothetical protein|nr:hypothetical protein [Nitrospira sp. BO4]